MGSIDSDKSYCWLQLYYHSLASIKNNGARISSESNNEKLKSRFKSQHDHYLKRSLVFLEVLQSSHSTKMNYKWKLFFLFQHSKSCLKRLLPSTFLFLEMTTRENSLLSIYKWKGRDLKHENKTEFILVNHCGTQAHQQIKKTSPAFNDFVTLQHV